MVTGYLICDQPNKLPSTKRQSVAAWSSTQQPLSPSVPSGRMTLGLSFCLKSHVP